MQNIQIHISPLQLHYSTVSALNIRLIYKKICITTNHQLQKYQFKDSFPIKNSIALINQQVKFNISKEFQLRNTKVVILVIGLRARQVVCLGDVTIDLSTIKDISTNGINRAKLDKSKDAKAFLAYQYKFIEKSSEIQKKNKQLPIQTGVLKSDHYYKEQLYISRRLQQDKPTAYEISRKNYKNTQITRNENEDRSIGKKSNVSSGSYKKRFQYQSHRTDKSRKKQVSKQSGSNYLKAYKRQKSPSPRTTTPQPIKLENRRPKIGQDQRRILSTLNLSNIGQSRIDHNESNQIEPDTFRPNYYMTRNQKNIVSQFNQQSIKGNTNQKANHQNHQNNPNYQNIYNHQNHQNHNDQDIHNDKSNRYKIITDKLQMIQSKIRLKHQKFSQGVSLNSENQDHDDQFNKTSPSMHRSQIQQSYEINNSRNLKSPIQQYSSHNVTKGDIQQTKFDQRSSLLSQNQDQSTCPRNLEAPSPIILNKTPQIKVQHQLQEFTVNQRKDQKEKNQLQQRKTASEDLKQNRIIKPFQIHSMLSPNGQQHQAKYFSVRQNKQIMRQSIGQRTMSRPLNQGLISSVKKQPKQLLIQVTPQKSSQRLQSSPKMQKKSSIGRNYLQTQVKMLELEIQDRDMKNQRLEKKINKLEQQNTTYLNDKEQAINKFMQFSKQFIKLKQHNIILTHKIQQMQDDKMITSKLSTQSQHLFPNQRLLPHQKQINSINQKSNLVQLQRLTELMKNRQSHIQELTNQVDNLKLIKVQYETICQQKQTLNKLITITAKSNQQKILKLNQSVERLQIKLLEQLKHSQQQKIIHTQQTKLLKNQQLKLLSQIEQLKQANQQLLEEKQLLDEKQSNQSQQFQKLQGKQSLESSKFRKQKTNLENKLQKLRLQKLQLVNNLNDQKEYINNLSAKLQQSTKLKQNMHQIIQIQRQKNIILFQQAQNQRRLNEQLGYKYKQFDCKYRQLELKNKQVKLKYEQVKLKYEQVELKYEQCRQQKQQESQQLKQQYQQNIQLTKENQSLKQQLTSAQRIKQQNQQLNQTIQKNNKFIQKLSILNQKNQQKTYSNQKKILQLESQLEQVIIDKMEIQQELEQIKSQFQLKNNKQQVNFKQSPTLRLSSVNEVQEHDDDTYQNQKRKSMNLQAQLRFAQTQIQSLTSQVNNLKSENKTLQNEISHISQINPQYSIPTKQQRQQALQLKEKVQMLQIQVHQLNNFLDNAIRKTSTIDLSKLSAKSLTSIQKQKNLGLIQQIQIYQEDLRIKKNKLADIINCVWKGGDAKLIQDIQKLMDQ